MRNRESPVAINPWAAPKPSDPRTGTEHPEASPASFNPGRLERRNGGLTEMNDATTLDDRNAAERRMRGDIPEYPAIFAKADKSLNRNLGEFHKYGLYTAKFGDQRAGTLQDVVLVKKEPGP
jgi:hypothetical protein